ncbi:radical SAM (seleno)protein TrsS [uncultured Desulfosarcina sp.]|uniref:radical SAM (seleno)protein TrsS n=1 Tax=uncultured Desulfosarcina sp. TaxID=218289 RepID=UPI0029C73D80|nr:radical SAM (seleno)protein TrsS [uncultured Desulfosarcina sp.]
MIFAQDTASLCPVCLSRIPAQRVVRGSAVYLEKSCPDHGAFSARIWEGVPEFTGWQRPKIPTRPPHCAHPVERGCPFDCGLCPDHRQRSCTIILEVTDRCNLACPVCYADARGMDGDDPSLATIQTWYAAAREAGAGSNIQLSGGEPTVREDLPRIVAMGCEAGFRFIQVNTNGLRLGRDPEFVRELKSAGLSSVFLQFDGTDDAIYRKLRGRDLLDEKLAAINACARNQIGVVLVPTLVPGVNDHDIGNILRLAVDRSPSIRSVHFQPVSYFGRMLHPPQDTDRLTLPQLMRSIEAQTGAGFKADHFKPPGCENALCSFSASFLTMPDKSVRAVGGTRTGKCCPAPIQADVGAAKAIAFVARQWGAAQRESTGPEPACRACDGDADGSMGLDFFLQRAKTHLLSVSAMAFQDVWNLDLERARDCCIHVMAPDRRLVPFCLYNLTGSTGQRLYRP